VTQTRPPTVIKRRRANWIGHILRRNCLLKPFIEGKIQVTGQRGRKSKQLLDGHKKTTKYRKLTEEALDRITVSGGRTLEETADLQ
jgi:hypothetical protein